ncbi:tetratricopeptide repeat protein [bacterium]|nr:tetratricopeptide repeat protein [bacterium]
MKLRLAQALSRLGRAGSEADRERAAGLFLELAEHEDRRGAAARAEEHLDSAVALLPDSLSVRNAQLEFLSRRGEAAALTRAHAELAALYLQAGDEERALSAYRAALALAPERVDLLAATADLLARRNQFSEARDLFLQLAERELAGHRIMAAISAYQRALSFRPDDAEVLDRLAEAYVAKGELSSALAQRRRRIALLREQGRREEMLAEYARLAQLDEENAQLLVEWAEALREADRPGEAVEKLRGAAEKYRGRELLGKAAEIYRGLFEENSRELEAGLLLARCHADMGQAEAAAGVLVEVARRALAVGEAARAEESLRKALEAHPRSRAARRALADFFAGRGQQTDAILWLMQLAALHRESGSPDRAAEVYAEVLEHDPDHEPACRQLLRCLEETGEEKRRLATLERLAGIHERRGATETALEEYLALVDHFLAAAEG